MTVLNPGTRLGRYELIRKLGHGGSARVWEAVLHGPRGFQKPVALKLLHNTGGTQKGNLLREARLGAMVSHPNVVETYDIAEAEGQPFVAMELVRGPTVGRLLQRSHGGLGGSRILDVATQACAGLHHIHALTVRGEPAGLVHRDIKPGNLILDRSGLVKIADLGIARLEGDRVTPAGTPGYMAPEQARGDVDHRADLFAMGTLMYRMATNRMPFGRGVPALEAAKGVEDLLARDDFLEPLDQALPGLAAIVAKCLRLHPDDRWQSAGELAQALTLLAGAQRPRWSDVIRPTLEAPTPTPISRSHTRTHLLPGLPASLDAFVQRPELERVTNAVFPGRLVTLHGLGGAGKTRLALEVARTLDSSSHPVFCDLSEAQDRDGMCFAVAASLGLQLDRDDPATRVGRALAARGRTIVILDNLEQVVEPAAELVSLWMKAAPELAWIATTRRALGLTAEIPIRIGPLGRDAAIELFLERCPSPVSADRETVGALVDDLDRMPLAIELAAARTRVLTVEAIRERLSFRLLAAHRRDRPHRQQSLRASLDGSWELLEPWEQAALAQLASFEGGATLSGAEGVIDLREWPDAPFDLEVIEALVYANLLDVRDDRFRMPQLVRAYALEKDPRPEATRDRHAAWFAQLGSPLRLARLDSRESARALRELSAEADNLMAALGRSLDAGNAEVSVACAIAAATLYVRLGPAHAALEVLDRIRSLEQRPEERLALRATALTRSGHPDRAVRLLRSATVRPEESEHACKLGLALSDALDAIGQSAESLVVCSTVQETAARAGLDRYQAYARMGIARAVRNLGRVRDAIAHLRQAGTLMEQTGDHRGMGRVMNDLGLVYADIGQKDRAAEAFRTAVQMHQRAGNERGEAVAMGNLTLQIDDQREPEKALKMLEEALGRHRRLGDPGMEGITLAHMARLQAQLGRTDRAVEILQESRALNAQVGDRRSEAIALSDLGALYADIGCLDEASAHFRDAVLANREVENRRAEGVALHGLGSVEFAMGRLPAARRHLRQAIDILDETRDTTTAPRARAVLARAERVAGDDRAARRWLAEAAVYGAAQATAEQGRRHLEAGRFAEAADLLGRALYEIDEGARFERIEILADLARAQHGLGDGASAKRMVDLASSLAGNRPTLRACVARVRAELA